jgi:large subunit ribosomal protein L22
MGKVQDQVGFIAMATLRNVRVAPRKARLVVDLIRGKQVEQALDILSCCDKKTALLVKKLLLSAVANASSQSVNVDELFVKRIWVNQGRTLHRIMPRARGTATPIRKRHSSITVLLDEVGAK